MALILSAATGNFNAGATWVGGVVPGVGDEARAENGHTITITANVTCDEVSNAGTGIYTLNDGVTLTANVTAKSTTANRNVVQFTATSPAAGFIVGNVLSGATSTNTGAVNNSSSGSLTITGNVTGGSASTAFGAHNASSGTLTITGNATGGSANAAIGANNGSTGTLNITGNATGGSGSEAFGVRNNSSGTLTITGNATGGSASQAVGASNKSTGTMTITGNVTGGSAASAHGAQNDVGGTLSITGNATGGSSNCNGAQNNGTGTMNITGNAIGGTVSAADGVRNNSTGTLNIIGNAVASNTSAGGFNASTGVMTAIRAVGNSFGIGMAGGVGSHGGILNGNNVSDTRVQELQYGVNGQSPITAGAVRIISGTNNKAIVTLTTSAQKTLADPSDSTGQANEADVRSGTSYALGNKTGTLAVPSANQVAVGVAVDNTVGTAVLTESTLRAAVGLASANLDTQLGDIKKTTGLIPGLL